MGPSRRGRTSRSVLLVISVVAGAALCWSSFAAAATPTRSSLAGTWTGSYSGAFSGTFTIHWRQRGSKLVGSIALSRPRGTYGITGSVHGKAIAFGAVSVGATYTGSVSGSSMNGSYKTPQGGGSWSASKSS
jgi:hypothetical protein